MTFTIDGDLFFSKAGASAGRKTANPGTGETGPAFARTLKQAGEGSETANPAVPDPFASRPAASAKEAAGTERPSPAMSASSVPIETQASPEAKAADPPQTEGAEASAASQPAPADAAAPLEIAAQDAASPDAIAGTDADPAQAEAQTPSPDTKSEPPAASPEPDRPGVANGEEAETVADTNTDTDIDADAMTEMAAMVPPAPEKVPAPASKPAARRDRTDTGSDKTASPVDGTQALANLAAGEAPRPTDTGKTASSGEDRIPDIAGTSHTAPALTAGKVPATNAQPTDPAATPGTAQKPSPQQKADVQPPEPGNGVVIEEAASTPADGNDTARAKGTAGPAPSPDSALLAAGQSFAQPPAAAQQTQPANPATGMMTPTHGIITASPAEAVKVITDSIASPDDRRDRVTVQLDPPELGRVSIDFKFDAHGLQHVTVTGENPEALRQLRLMHFELSQALERSGLSSQNMTFQQGQQQGHPGQQQAQPGPHPRLLNLAASSDEAASAPSAPLTQPARPTRIAGSGIDIRL